MSTNTEQREQSTPDLAGDPQELLSHYKEAAQDEQRDELRLALLLALRDDPDLLAEPGFASFLGREVDPHELGALEWASPEAMRDFSEAIYTTRYDEDALAQRLDDHAAFLLHRALRHYEEESENGQLFEHMRLAPTYLLRNDEELRRLLYRANAFELRRVRRLRRYLYAYLVLHVILVLFVFPFLFINAENGRLEQQVEQLTDVEIGDEGYQRLSYAEGVYWSLITAGSIGYGDITPQTNIGRVIAGILGTMGVITVGIVAGLVLDWITPRRIS